MSKKEEIFRKPPDCNYVSTNTNLSELAYYVKHVGEVIVKEIRKDGEKFVSPMTDKTKQLSKRCVASSNPRGSVKAHKLQQGIDQPTDSKPSDLLELIRHTLEYVCGFLARSGMPDNGYHVSTIKSLCHDLERCRPE